MPGSNCGPDDSAPFTRSAPLPGGGGAAVFGATTGRDSLVNPEQLASQIRFALSNLPARNAHHVFEDICRHLTAQFICSNVLPATGPVSAGGDQGRDFETFRSYLRRELGAAGAFLGLVSEGVIAFVCTTQADGVAAKLAADVKKVCASGQPVHEIKAFSLSSLPVGNRHKLQSETQETYGISIEIFDGPVMAELLASPDGFWIAEQFLALPSEIGPPRPAEEDANVPHWYVELRSRWRAKSAPEPTLGDLVSLKAGLREATFSQHARPDLPFWLGRFRTLLAHSDLSAPLRQRARYELIVATLRGTGDLHPVDEVTREYLNGSMHAGEPARIEDASVLLTYCSGAIVAGVTAITSDEVLTWHAALRSHVETLMKGAPPNRRAALLFVLGHLGSQPALSDARLSASAGPLPDMTDWDVEMPSLGPLAATEDVLELFVDVDLMFSAWTDLAEGLDQTPFFPVDRLSSLLAVLAPLVVDHPDWRRLSDLVDEAVGRVSGSSAAADRARDRALQLFEAGRLVEALEEFHRAKVRWLAGDTLRGSLLAMLMISRIYLALRLPEAAKAHGLAVATVAAQSDDEDLADLVPRGLLVAAEGDFVSGAWCGATELLEIALAAQYECVEDGSDFEKHEAVQQAVLLMAYISACAQDIYPTLAARVAASASRVGVEEIIAGVLETSDASGGSSWLTFGPDELTGAPFSDLGEERWIRFSALGTDWLVKSAIDANSVRGAERFSAAAQATLAELASEDLGIIPTRITVVVEVGTGASRAPEEGIEALPSNDGRAWKVRLISAAEPGDVDPNNVNRKLLVALATILRDASLLPQSDFEGIMERALDRGLAHMLSPARPYDELAAAWVLDEHYVEMDREQFSTPWDCFDRPSGAHEQLQWKDGPGPTFERGQAEEMLRNRYDVFSRTLQKTLPKLRRSKQFGQTVRRLREAGWLDWHLLTAIASIVMTYRFSSTGQDPRDPSAREEMVQAAFEPEHESSLVPPAHTFTAVEMQRARHVAMLPLVRHWGLEFNQPTPDFPAIERLLAARYGYWDDDVEHVDPFLDSGFN